MSPRVPFLAAMLLCVSAVSAAATPKADPGAAIRQALQKAYPELRIEQVRASDDWPGLFEVVTETEVIYSNSTGSRLLAGKLVDTATKSELTTRRWNELHRIEFSQLPVAQAAKTVRGNGSRVLALFEDPLCPYCKQLEQALAKVDNVTVYTFLYPLEDLHPGATERARRIWCSSDRAAAWSKWMLSGADPDGKSCGEFPLDQLMELGQKLDVSSTPTLFFANGRRVSGALSTAELEQELGGTTR